MQPFQIMSYWDMLQISPETMSALAFVAGCRAEWELWMQLLQNAGRLGIAPINISMQTRAHFLNSCKILGETAAQLGMKASQTAADRASKDCFRLLASPIGFDAPRLARVVSLAGQLLQVFGDEMGGHLLFTLSSRHAHLFSEPAPFGAKVEDAFPSATFDIAEAAKCRALGRWTACVMHMMRVMEVGLRSLARHFDVSADANWNQVLNQIEAKSREVSKRADGAEAEQWAAEAATHLRFVKNAWRNHAMHPTKTYDEERAVTIYESSRSFMQHLSSRLSEDDLLQ